MAYKTLNPIVIYTTESCDQCQAAKQYLDGLGAQYKERDIYRDPCALEEMLDRTRLRIGLPVIAIGSHTIVGFDRLSLTRLLA